MARSSTTTSASEFEKRDIEIQPAPVQPDQRQDITDPEKRVVESSIPATNGQPGAVDTASNSTTVTNTPLILPETRTSLERFNSVTARDGRHLDGPPELPFNLRNHKLSLSIFTFLALAECCFVPIAFYYGFSQASNVRSGIYFAIITSLFGFVSGYEVGIRGWRLILKSDEYRPLYGASRWWADSTQFVIIMPFTVMTIILIIFSIPHYPNVKALALPMPVGMINFGLIFVVNGWAAERGWRLLHFRLSSHVKNSICPPLTFCMMEDICAVDGKGGKKYREAAMARYNSSPRFRALMMQLLWFWSISAIVVGAATIVAIWLTTDDIAYGVGWGVPNVWAGIWIWITVIWVQRALRIEKETWLSDRSRTG